MTSNFIFVLLAAFATSSKCRERYKSLQEENEELQRERNTCCNTILTATSECECTEFIVELDALEEEIEKLKSKNGEQKRRHGGKKYRREIKRLQKEIKKLENKEKSTEKRLFQHLAVSPLGL